MNAMLARARKLNIRKKLKKLYFYNFLSLNFCCLNFKSFVPEKKFVFIFLTVLKRVIIKLKRSTPCVAYIKWIDTASA